MRRRPTRCRLEFDRLPCRVLRPGALLRRVARGRRAREDSVPRCPLRTACLAGALERQEPWGVWGGELFVQGVVVAAQAAPRPSAQVPTSLPDRRPRVAGRGTDRRPHARARPGARHEPADICSHRINQRTQRPGTHAGFSRIIWLMAQDQRIERQQRSSDRPRHDALQRRLPSTAAACAHVTRVRWPGPHAVRPCDPGRERPTLLPRCRRTSASAA